MLRLITAAHSRCPVRLNIFIAPLFLLSALMGPAFGANIRFIISSGTMGNVDQAVHDLMTDLGHTVNLRTAHQSSTEDTAGSDLVVISSTVSSSEVNSKFRNVAKPVILNKNSLFDDMGMVGTAASQTGSITGGQVAIQDPTHPLAAGLSGTVQVYSPDDNLNWGIPTTEALRIISLTTDATRFPLFAYESGANMAGMAAPARRVGFFFRDFSVIRSTANGDALFQAAVTWCLGAAGTPPSIQSGPSSLTVDAGEPALFSVSAIGNPPPSYQWSRDGTAIPGATGSTYLLSAATPGDDGSIYRVTVANAAGSAEASAVLSVLYRPEFILPQSAQAFVQGYPGAPFTFEVLAKGNPPPTYEWTSTNPAFTGPDSTGRIIHVTVRDGPTGTNDVYMATARNSQGFSSTRSLSVTTIGLPHYYVTPPVGDLSEGQGLTLAIGPETPTGSLQWLKDGQILPGATSATYSIASAAFLDQGLYSVVVINAQYTVTSDPCSVTVRIAPRITIQPAGATADEGQAAAFSVTAEGNPSPTYQWLRNGTDIAGATASTYSTTALGPDDDGAAFTVVVSNSEGSVTSQNAPLSVRYAPSILAHPASTAVQQGQSHTFTVSVRANPAAAFQWARNGVPIAGATTESHTVASAPFSESGAAYSAIVSNSLGSVSSAAAVLTVIEPLSAPVITAQPVDAVVRQGMSPVFRIGVAGNPAPQITWHYGYGSGYQFGTGDTAVFPYGVALRDSGLQVWALVQNSEGGVRSEDAFILVQSPPTRQMVSITGELFMPDGETPYGSPTPIGMDMTVRLFAAPSGGPALYTEDFHAEDGMNVLVSRGLFTVRLGEGWTPDNLSQVVAASANLFAEFSIRSGSDFQTLLPRTPVTAPLFAGGPSIAQGAANPTGPAPAGSYYQNASDGSTWLRMPGSWVRIAP